MTPDAALAPVGGPAVGSVAPADSAAPAPADSTAPGDDAGTDPTHHHLRP